MWRLDTLVPLEPWYTAQHAVRSCQGGIGAQLAARVAAGHSCSSMVKGLMEHASPCSLVVVAYWDMSDSTMDNLAEYMADLVRVFANGSVCVNLQAKRYRKCLSRRIVLQLSLC